MKFPLVVVEWCDAYSIDKWERLQDLDVDGKPCLTAGYLVKKTKDTIAVSSTVAEDEDVCCTLIIPKGMIKRMSKVKG